MSEASTVALFVNWPTPSQEDLQKITNDHINLYTKEASPDAITILVAPDETLDNSEIVEAVK